MECIAISNKQEKTLDLTTYQHSDRIANRRKALFPSVSDDGSDLGPMSPLSDTNSDPFDAVSDKNRDDLLSYKDYFSAFRNNINNYVIINRKCADSNELEEIINSETLTDTCIPCLSPTNRLNLTKARETEFPESPTKNLKTPHEIEKSNVKVPKLVRKHNGESMHDIETGKHNFSPTNSPCNKVQKVDNGFCKLSKVRTALFPDVSLPVHSFYPKSDQTKADKSLKHFNVNSKKTKAKSTPTYLCNRRQSNRNRFGQINAGVRHKIKKPKQRIPAKICAKKTAMSVVESSHLVEFIKDMNYLTEIRPKLIKVLCKNDKSVEDRACVTQNKVDGNVDKSDDTKLNSDRKKFKTTCENNTITEIKKISKGTENKIILDLLDFVNDNEDLSVPKLDHVFDVLAEEERRDGENSESNQIILKTSNTISDSDNSILFHHPHDSIKFNNCKERKRKLENKENDSAEVLLSPTSQMCDMTSVLAINSPKRARLNITNIIENTQGAIKDINIFNKISSNSEMDKEKLFPIFYPSRDVQNKRNTTRNGNTKAVGIKKWRALSENQMLLDAGQKRFGFTQCPECEIVYHMGDPNDEVMHENYHNARNILSFKGWKNENVVGGFSDAKIIKVSPGDSKIWWKKVKDLVEVVNRDLGYFEVEYNIDDSVIFLYIKNKTITGCLIAEPKTEAFKMLSSFDGIDLCSKESYPIKCGISRIWVSQNNRRNGVATALMECMRANFCYGYILELADMALSSPSETGKMFAKKYFKTDNFLIYTS